MRFIILFILSISLSACGFALRGPVKLSEDIKTIAIVPDDPYRPLQRTVREELLLSGINVTHDTNQGDVILKLTPEEISRNTYAIDTSGDVAQELITYVLEFELVDKENNILLPKQFIKTDRMLYIHNNQLLSVDREERVLINEMRRDAAQQLIRRLAAYQP